MQITSQIAWIAGLSSMAGGRRDRRLLAPDGRNNSESALLERATRPRNERFIEPVLAGVIHALRIFVAKGGLVTGCEWRKIPV